MSTDLGPALPDGASDGPAPDHVRDAPGEAALPADDVVEESLLDPLDDIEALDPDEMFVRHRVVAVLVAHDGLPWIERALDAVDAQVRPPQRLYVVDTGSTDGTAGLLAGRIGPGVESLPRETGFGAAVAHVLEADSRAPGLPVPVDPSGARVDGRGSGGDVVDWVWLLHDDCAPEPQALRMLLAAVDQAPSVAVVGPKVVGWADPRHLLEVGVTIARSGARDTGLERREQDQGQHDRQRSVLAVSTAGMLVRRDVWDELGGLEPRLPLFRDDIDFGWRANAAGHRVLVAPDAVLHHAEAASHRRRPISVGPDQPHRLDRQHSLEVLLANMPAWVLPWTLLRLCVGTLLRAVAFLVGKDPGFALAELRALGTTLAHPGDLRAMRRARKATARVGYRDLRGLLAPPGTQVRHGVDVLLSTLAADTRRPSRIGPQPTAGSTGGGDRDGADDGLQPTGPGVVRRTLTRPGVLVALGVLVLTLVAERSLLGGGRLLGGALLPAPDGPSDLWSTYTAPWHAVGVGSPGSASASTPVLAALSLLVLGKVSFLVDLIVLLCVPAAVCTAYLALRGVVTSVPLRAWAALTYGLLPAAVGAVATGRLGSALVLVLLPLVARPALRLGGVIGPDATWRTAWGAGLLLALLASFVPVLWVLAVVLAVVAAATTARGRGPWLRLAAAVAVTPVVLVPWTWQLVTHPSYLLVEAGVVSGAIAPVHPRPWAVLLSSPGGPAAPPVWVGLGLLLAAVAAVLGSTRRRAAATTAVVALAAFGLAAVVAAIRVRTPQLTESVPTWTGGLLVVAGGALVVAAVVAAEGARERLSGTSFGWRQPVVVVVVALCVLGPVVVALGWVARGADGPLRRGSASGLPAFVAVDADTSSQPRTLALRPDGTGVVSYSLLRDNGAQLGDAEASPQASAAPELPSIVSDLASGRGGVSGTELVGYGVRYVVIDSGADATGVTSLSRTLDGVPGLRRLSSMQGDAVWKVTGVTGRARLVPTTGRTVVLPSEGLEVDAPLPSSWSGGTLQLSEVADSGWHATLAGQRLEPTVVDGWQQGFLVPAAAKGAAPATLQVTFTGSGRGRWVTLEVVLVLLVVVLALPSRRREGEGEDS